jgi:hypothetical protein
VVLRGVSPLIWRRLLLRGDTSVADLHATLQAALGWRDEHLHRFIIQGRCYGDGGRSNPRRVRLSDLGLRERERFRYEYDFSDGWQHDLRVEQILSPEPGRTYPRCTGGQRAAPPEDCGGPWAFLELRQHYSAGRIATRLVAIFESLVSDQRYGRELVDDLDEDDGEAKAQELEELGPLAEDRSLPPSCGQPSAGAVRADGIEGGGMRVRVQVIVEPDGDDDEQVPIVHEVASIERSDRSVDTLGLQRPKPRTCSSRYRRW